MCANESECFTAISERLISVINDLYLRPAMYGPTPMEVEASLRAYHWFWALLHNREDELNTVIQSAMPVGRRSLTGSFVRLY